MDTGHPPLECQILERADDRLVLVPVLFQLGSAVERAGPYRHLGLCLLDPLALSADAMHQLAARGYAVLGADDADVIRRLMPACRDGSLA